MCLAAAIPNARTFFTCEVPCVFMAQFPVPAAAYREKVSSAAAKIRTVIEIRLCPSRARNKKDTSPNVAATSLSLKLLLSFLTSPSTGSRPSASARMVG